MCVCERERESRERGEGGKTRKEKEMHLEHGVACQEDLMFLLETCVLILE